VWKYGGVPSCWKSMLSWPSSSKIDTRNYSKMSMYTLPLIVCSPKKEGPNTFCVDKAQTVFSFGLSPGGSITSWQLLLPHNLRFCQLTFPSDQLHVSTIGAYNFKLQLFPQNCVLLVRQCTWLMCELHLPEFHWLVVSWAFSQTSAVHLILQSVPLVRWHFVGFSLPDTVQNLCRTITTHETAAHV
jgi:hypothetical protein